MRKEKGLSRREFLKWSAAAAGGLALLRMDAFGQKEPIKIGLSISITGRFERPATYQLEGHKLWADHVNKEGGIEGRPVRLFIYDDKSDPAETVKLCKKLITDDKVDLLFSPYGSELTVAAAPVIEEAGIPTVASIVATTIPWKGKNAKWMIQLSAPAQLYLTGAVDLAAKEGKVKNIAILYEDTAFPIGVAEGLRERAKALGLTILLDEKYDKAVTDWTPLVAKAKAAGAEFLAGGAYYPAAVGITKAAAAVGYKLTLLALVVGVADPKFVKDMGPLAEGVAGNDIWLPTVKSKGFLVEKEGAIKTITNEEFVKSYTAAFARAPEYWSASGYGGGQLLAQAINESIKTKGKLEKEAVRDFLFAFEGETVYGPYGVAKLDTPDAGLQLKKDNYVIQWQKGVKEVIWPKEAATAAALFGWPR